jgi:hypothetical protein
MSKNAKCAARRELMKRSHERKQPIFENFGLNGKRITQRSVQIRAVLLPASSFEGEL